MRDLASGGSVRMMSGGDGGGLDSSIESYQAQEGEAAQGHEAYDDDPGQEGEDDILCPEALGRIASRSLFACVAALRPIFRGVLNPDTVRVRA